MIILGIDPGTIRTGWGVVRREGPKFRFIAAGTIQANARRELPERLHEIYESLRAVIAEHSPNAMAVEDVFHSRFASSALKLGHARGVALLVGAQAGLPIAAIPPALVKRSIAGRGQADKTQVARIVGAMLGLRALPDIDATDALAIAITHAQALLAQRLQRRSSGLSLDRAVDLPCSQGAPTTHSGSYVEEKQRSERGKDQAR